MGSTLLKLLLFTVQTKKHYIMNAIKKTLFILLGAAALLYTSGCFIDIDDDDDFIGCIRADGPIITERINMASFTGIDLEIAGEVYIRQGSEQIVEIEAPEEIVEEMEFDVRNDIWEIETDRCLRYDGNDLRIFITLPNLDYLRISGSGDIISENIFLIDDLELQISGSGIIDVAAEADDIFTRISGSGDILLEGTADDLDFEINGSGDIKAFDLLANAADVNISGSGDAEVNVSDELNVRISGSGDVLYRGNPVVDSRISGSGRVIDAN
jgi:hypothetical protein